MYKLSCGHIFNSFRHRPKSEIARSLDNYINIQTKQQHKLIKQHEYKYEDLKICFSVNLIFHLIPVTSYKISTTMSKPI